MRFSTHLFNRSRYVQGFVTLPEYNYEKMNSLPPECRRVCVPIPACLSLSVFVTMVMEMEMVMMVLGLWYKKSIQQSSGIYSYNPVWIEYNIRKK